MNADDLSKYQRMLATRQQLLDFAEMQNEPSCIVVHVPNWLDVETRRTTSESARGVFISDKAAMAVIIDRARTAARAQIKTIETELTAAGITFPTEDAQP